MFSRASRILSVPVLRGHQLQRIAHARRRLATSAEKKAEKEATDNDEKGDWQLIAKVVFYIATVAVPWSFLTQIRDDLEFRYYMEDNHPEKLRKIESLFPGFVPPLSSYEYQMTEKPEKDVEIVVQKDNEELHSLVDSTTSVKDLVASLSLDSNHSIRTCPSTFPFSDPVQWIHRVADNSHLYVQGVSMSKEQLKEYVSKMESRVASAHQKLSAAQAQFAQGSLDEVEVDIAQKELDVIAEKYRRYSDILKRWDVKTHWKPEIKKNEEEEAEVAPVQKKSSFSLFSYFTSKPKPDTKAPKEQPVEGKAKNPHLDSAEVLAQFVKKEKAQRQSSLHPYGPEVDENFPELFTSTPEKQLIMSKQQERLAVYVLKKVDDKISGASGENAEEAEGAKGIGGTKPKTLGDIFSEGKKLSMKGLKADEKTQQESTEGAVAEKK